MNYEQKYKEALERAKDNYNAADSANINVNSFKNTLIHIFPELKESEDERIRKAILEHIQLCSESIPDRDKWIAWLEKQGKQKPVEDSLTLEEFENAFITKAEQYDIDLPNRSWDIYALCKELYSLKHKLKQGEQKSINDLTQQETMNIADTKFKFGDWVVYNRNDHSRKIMQIYDIRDNRYYFNDNIHFSWSVKECDEKSHLWTIEDAKDGDVLAVNSEVFIYAHRKQMYPIVVAHCFVDSAGGFRLDGEFGFLERGNSISPATKEQRDLLFSKMKEEGYEWSAEKKELIKL